MADMTEKNWQRHLAETVDKLGLGRDIKGYLRAAREPSTPSAPRS